MKRIPPRWRWFVYWVVFSAALTALGWVLYGVLSWLVVAIQAILAAPATALVVWREERRTTSDRAE